MANMTDIALTTLTELIVNQFNEAFRLRTPFLLDGILAEQMVLETAAPAPNGKRHKGMDACLSYWHHRFMRAESRFSTEKMITLNETAVVHWHCQWGAGAENTVRGVHIVTLEEGIITYVMEYVKDTYQG